MNIIPFDAAQATNLLTLCLVLITGLYCFYTYRIVEKNEQIVAQMKAQYDSFIAPVITVTVEIRHSVVVCLKVRNCGRSPARNLRLALDRDFYQFGEFEETRNIRNFSAFQQVIPSFSPGDELFFQVCQGFNLGKQHGDQAITPPEFTIDVRFDFDGRAVEEHHRIDLRAYFQSAQDRSEMVEELEKIRKVLEKKQATAA